MPNSSPWRACSSASTSAPPAPARAGLSSFGDNPRDPAIWRAAAFAALAVDGTSGTLLALDASGVP